MRILFNPCFKPGSNSGSKTCATPGVTAAAALVFATGLAGCGNARLGELEQFVAEVQDRPAAQLEPVPQIKQIENYIYEPDGRRDPFVMDQQSAEAVAPERTGSNLMPDRFRRKEALESYSLDSLRMVGTLSQDEQIWGLVRSPDGILHRVAVGNFMGLNDGRITDINQQGIQLTELVNEGADEWVERQASIALTQ